MRQLSFIGYLKEYIKDVSGLSSLNIHKLCKELKNNQRLVDPLILYCALTKKQEALIKYTNAKYWAIVYKVNKDNFHTTDFKKYDFKKIWDDYQNRLNYQTNDNYFKNSLREEIVSLMKKKSVSKYRIYTDLKLNHGNINAYLKNNDASKVSSQTAKRIYKYVLAI